MKLKPFGVLVASIALGFVWLLGVWLFSAKVGHQLWITLVVIFYGSFIATYHRWNESAVDSTYYLGFIFTLLALFFSLLQFIFADDKEVPDEFAIRVIASFSVAITSTLIGLIFRVVLSQWNEFVLTEANPENAANRLASASGRVAIEMESAAKQIEKTGIVLAGSLQNTSKEMQVSSRKFLNDYDSILKSMLVSSQEGLGEVLGSLRKSSEDYSRALENSSSNYNEMLVASTKTLGDVASQLNELITSLRTSISTIESSILETNQIAERRFQDLVDDTVNNISGAATESLNKVVDAHIIKLGNIEQTSSEVLGKMTDAASNQLSALTENLPDFHQIGRSINDLVNGLQECESRIQRITNDISQQKSHLETVNATFSQLSMTLGSVDKNIEEVNDAVQRYKELGKNLEAQVKNAMDVNTRLNQLVVETAKKVMDELDRNMKRGNYQNATRKL